MANSADGVGQEGGGGEGAGGDGADESQSVHSSDNEDNEGPYALIPLYAEPPPLIPLQQSRRQEVIILQEQFPPASLRQLVPSLITPDLPMNEQPTKEQPPRDLPLLPWCVRADENAKPAGSSKWKRDLRDGETDAFLEANSKRTRFG